MINPKLSDLNPYNAVLLAYRPLAILLKIYGVHPFRMQKPMSKCCCHRPGIWMSILFNSLLVLLSLGLSIYVDFVLAEGDVNIDTTKMSFWVICACALIHMVASLTKGKLNSEVHFKWRLIDKRLNIAVDRELKQWSSKMVASFVVLKLLFFGTSAALVFTDQDATSDTACVVIKGTIMTLLVWQYCAILVPQMCYYYFCWAIQSRFTVLGASVQRVLSDDQPDYIGRVDAIGQRDIAIELEHLRHTYHLLVELTQDISTLLSPMILLGFLLDSGMICTCMYRLIQLWQDERWSVPLEMVAMVTAVVKILATTMLGSSVTNSAQLFALTTADDEPGFSASGFFGIDRRLFTATVGTVATYFVVLLQFRTEET